VYPELHVPVDELPALTVVHVALPALSLVHWAKVQPAKLPLEVAPLLPTASSTAAPFDEVQDLLILLVLTIIYPELHVPVDDDPGLTEVHVALPALSLLHCVIDKLLPDHNESSELDRIY